MLPRIHARACAVLDAGGVIAYPTEGVWGLGCDPANGPAVARLLAIKRRPVEKGLILIAADFAQLVPWLAPPAPEALARAQASWPGPNTWLFAASEAAPPWITGGNPKIAVRVTDHDVARRLCRAWGGPLVSTSANRSGEAPAESITTLRRRLGRDVDLVVPGRLGGLGRPSVVRDADSGAMLRP